MLLFFQMLVGHAFMDFPMQSGPIAVEKCRHSKSELQKQVPWYYWLTAHALLHGGAVYYITGLLGFGLLETVCHWIIDFAKCEGWTNIHIDQALHVACKVLWVVLILNGIRLEF